MRIFLQRVGHQSDDAGEGEDGARRTGPQLHHPTQRGQAEVDVRRREAKAPGGVERGVDHLQRPLIIGHGGQPLQQMLGPRVGAAVDTVPEAGNRAGHGSALDRGERPVAGARFDQQGLDRQRGTAVQAAPERPEPGEHDSIWVRPGRCGHPRRQRRCRQLVIGQQHQRGVERRDLRRPRTPAVPPQSRPRSLGRRRFHPATVAGDQLQRAGEHPPRGTPHRVRTPVGPLCVGGAQRGDGDRDQLGRADPGREQRTKARDQLSIGPAQRPRSQRVTVPEQAGHVLKAAEAREFDRVAAAVVQATVRIERGQFGLDHDLERP